MKRILLSAIAAALTLPVVNGTVLASEGRYGQKPPVRLSRHLVDPWVLQLRPSYRFGKSRKKLVSPRYRDTPRARRAAQPSRAISSPQRPSWARVAAVPRARVTAPAPRKRSSRSIDPKFLPTIVDYDGGEAKGTIVIDTSSRYLYLVEGNGRARRYGVGVGRPGFEWAGTHKITRKAEWPSWRPPAEMRARQPGLPVFMAGGPRNPLGARALYLGSTLYRIHGSNEPWTIGRAVSSGCIRMRNEDVIDLYNRVKVGTTVIVR